MAFRVPTFNLAVNIWNVLVALPPVPAPDVITVGQLAWDSVGGRMFLPRAAATRPTHSLALRLPFGTDVRYATMTGGVDSTVEVPAGSGRYYVVYVVDDVAKGFANEYRVAMVSPVAAPSPLP